MPKSSLPRSEPERLDTLRSYHVLDSAAEPTFDSLTQLAAKICGTSMAVLTFVDEHRQWFKSRLGVDVSETPREIAFCSHTVEQAELFEVHDAQADPAFRDNPLVRQHPNIRFYAGAPLLTENGCAIGSLAVIDSVPRSLSSEQKDMLVHLARHAMLQLDLRRTGWRSTERYRVITEASPLPIIMLDRELKVVLWNPAAERLFGWRADEVLGRDYPLVPLSERASYREMLAQVFSGNTVSTRDVARRHRDGTIVRVDAFWAPVRTEHGEVAGAMVILQDVTAQLESEAKLQQSFSLLSATLESTADGILVVDRKGKVVARNRRFSEIWGLPPEVLDHGSDAEAISAALHQLKDPSTFLVRVNELYSRPELDSFDVLEFVDGRIIERYSQPQRIGNEIAGRVWSFRDVTERVTLESHLRQSQKMEAVGALAGGIAHDFNNLLNIIIGYNSLISAEVRPGDALAGYTEKIGHAAARAAGLTRQLLAFSRRQVLRPEVLDINELIRDLSQMLPRVLPESIELKLDLHADPMFVHADPGQLEQVLMNLAVNARDAMPGGGELQISTRPIQDERTDEPRECAEITVSDTGQGIDPVVLSRIFEPFFTTKPLGRGTGLGLSTAYGIIRQSNGVIRVKSEVGQGSAFSIVLPVVSEPAASAEPNTHSTVKPSAFKSANVLLVEDDLSLRPLIAHILSVAGYRVVEALSPEHALQTIAQPDIPIDLLLTDVVMPGMGGGELAEKALQLRPGLKVAFMSGYPEEELRQRCGTATLIEKPVAPDVLIDHVRSVLAHQPRESGNEAA